MTLDESVDGLISSSDPHDHLIVLSFDEYPLLPVCVHPFLLPHEKQTCLAVHLVIVDVLSELFVNWIILHRLVDEVHPLQVIHVLMNPLKLVLALPYLVQRLLMLLDEALKLVLALLIATFHDVELVHEVLVLQVLLAHLIFQIVNLCPQHHVHFPILIKFEALVCQSQVLLCQS